MLFGMDIGGTLAKIVFREPEHIGSEAAQKQVLRLREYFSSTALSGRMTGPEDINLRVQSRKVGGKLHFISFETTSIETLFDVIRKELSHSPAQVQEWKIYATGGGSHKYEARFWSEMGVHLRKSDEMETIVSGVMFLAHSVHDECYTWMPPEPTTFSHMGMLEDSSKFHMVCFTLKSGAGHARVLHLRVRPAATDLGDCAQLTVNLQSTRKPWLVVNVGSGVSMLKLDEQQTVAYGRVGTYKRVGGTPVGGGTWMAIGCLLTGVQSHDELLEMAERGDAAKVDKLVGDIYGDDYKGLGLSSDTVASSFGKLVDPSLRANCRKEDLAASLTQAATPAAQKTKSVSTLDDSLMQRKS